MTECISPNGHKWILVQSDPHSGIAYGYFIECEHGCGELHPDQAESMLNEHEALKRENEALRDKYIVALNIARDTMLGFAEVSSRTKKAIVLLTAEESE